MIPAVLYGRGGDAINLALNPKDVREILLSSKGQNSVFSLEVDGGETVDCAIVGDYQKDPVKRTLVHCDLLRLDPNSPREFQIPFRLVGTSKAEKLGGRTIFSTRSSWVQCTPMNVPECIEIDVTDLDIGDRIRIADVEAPEGVKLVFTQNAPIVTAAVALAIIEEELDDVEGEEGEEGAEGAEGAAASDAASASDKSDDGGSE